MPNISRIKLPNGTIYTIVDKDGRAMIATNFDTETDYAAGSLVVYNNKLYRFDTDHEAGNWNANEVTETTVSDELTIIRGLISGGVHFIGTTTTPIYDGSTNPNIVINGTTVTAQNGDLTIFEVTSSIATEYQTNVALTAKTYYYRYDGAYEHFYLCNQNVSASDNTSWSAVEQYMDWVGDEETSSVPRVVARLEFIWDGTNSKWNAFGSATAFGELAFKDKVTGTYTKPTGNGSVTVNMTKGSGGGNLDLTTIRSVGGQATVSKVTAQTAVNVATVDTAKRYGTANVGVPVIYGTANRASTATTVGNANVGEAVAVATQGSTFYYGTADVDSSVTVATAGTDVVYGKANVGTAVTYGNANVGTTVQNVAIANGATSTYALDGVVVSMDQDDGELLVISNATRATMTQVTSTASIVQAAASNTTLTPAVAAPSTQKLTPVGGTTSITPAKSAGTAHSAVGVGGTRNITPAVTSTTSIYGAVTAPSTQTLTPAAEAPSTQTIVPAKANGSIVPLTAADVTVATVGDNVTVATGSVSSSGLGTSVITSLTTTPETYSVSVGTTTDTLTSK